MAEERALLEAEREAWLSGESIDPALLPHLSALPDGDGNGDGDEDSDGAMDASATSPASPTPPDVQPCTWPALTTLTPGLRVNLHVDDDAHSRVHHRVLPDGDTLTIAFDERGDDAHFTGEDRFRCIGATLVLEETEIDAQRIRFVPPLPVLAETTAALGAATETTLLVREEDRHWSVSGIWSATVEPVDGPPALQLPGRTFLAVRSHLAFDAPEAGPWETVTLWALGNDEIFVAARTQQVREPGPGERPVIHTRSVRAQWVFRDEGPETPAPQD